MRDMREALRDYIVTEFKPVVPVNYQSPLVQQGIIDSLAIFMLIGFVKNEFDVEIDPDDVTIENFETIDAIEQLIVSTRSSMPGSGA